MFFGVDKQIGRRSVIGLATRESDQEVNPTRLQGTVRLYPRFIVSYCTAIVLTLCSPTWSAISARF